MRATKLILIEGIPGSGKSTTAQALAATIAAQRIAVRWWYEEEAAHPIYVFKDAATLAQVRDDLTHGRYRAVIDAALAQWRTFAALVAADERVVVIDSCLFGYLTWSLFPLDLPDAEIRGYITDVLRIIAPLQPALIYLRQGDIARSLTRICARRGGKTEAHLTRQGTESPYGRRLGLHGFAGMVGYWTAYRELTDAACAAADLPTLTIDTTAGEWDRYLQQAHRFLDLPTPARQAAPTASLARYVGSYRYTTLSAAGTASLAVEDGVLLLDGVPQIWPRTPLLPQGANTFVLASLPFSVTFEEDAGGQITQMHITGPALLGGRLPTVCKRDEAEA